MRSVRIASTFTPTPSDERTSLTGTSNAISRVVTTWLSASTGLTRWMPSVRTRSWCPAFTTSPTAPGGMRMNSRETIPTRTAATAATMITARSAAASGRNRPDAVRAIAIRIHSTLIGGTRRMRTMTGTRPYGSRRSSTSPASRGARRRLGDLDVRRGERLRLVERHGLGLGGRGRLRRVVGHGWEILRLAAAWTAAAAPATAMGTPTATGTRAGGRVEATTARGAASRWR